VTNIINSHIKYPRVQFGSLYEVFDPLTTLSKARMFDWFVGAVLDNRWNAVNEQGIGTFTMVDTYLEGFEIKSGGGSGDNSLIEMDGRSHFDAEVGIGMIAVQHRFSNGQGTVKCGITPNPGTNSNAGFLENDAAQSFQRLVTNFSGTNTVDTSLIPDQLTHVMKLKQIPGNMTLTMDGVLEATSTSNVPISGQQPFYLARFGTSTAGIGRISYLEIWNI